MDTPSSESNNAPLNTNTAADAFNSLLTLPKEPEKTAEAREAEALDEVAAQAVAEVEAVEPDEGKVTIEVDGKPLELSKAELAEAYKNGLRQADYTKKTMESAEVRKTADAEIHQARQERQAYAQGLHKNALQLEAVMEQQSSIDWDALISSDPQEALRQQHLLQKRQAAYQQTVLELQRVNQHSQAEQAEQMKHYRASQQQELLAKLPEWKDASKATAEAASIKTYLKSQGFEDALIDTIQDHRHVVISRKAMLYDAMIQKAQAAAKKVQALPQKVVRPGVGDTPHLDGRSSAMQKLSKSGKVEDAASVFASFI